MRSYLELGSAPVEEKCVQVSKTEYYLDAMIDEAYKYKELLEQKFSNRPEGTKFMVKSYSHDFGDYYEVVFVYDDENEEHEEYAYQVVEDQLPLTWAG
jgi:hypothetical protein